MRNMKKDATIQMKMALGTLWAVVSSLLNKFYGENFHPKTSPVTWDARARTISNLKLIARFWNENIHHRLFFMVKIALLKIEIFLFVSKNHFFHKFKHKKCSLDIVNAGESNFHLLGTPACNLYEQSKREWVWWKTNAKVQQKGQQRESPRV